MRFPVVAAVWRLREFECSDDEMFSNFRELALAHEAGVYRSTDLSS